MRSTNTIAQEKRCFSDHTDTLFATILRTGAWSLQVLSLKANNSCKNGAEKYGRKLNTTESTEV